MAHILVTGGAGNIGSALVGRLFDRGDTSVVVADNLLTGDIEKLPKGRDDVRFVKCDVNDHDDIAALFYSRRFDYVFHLAAVVGVERTQRHPLWVLRDITGIRTSCNFARTPAFLVSPSRPPPRSMANRSRCRRTKRPHRSTRASPTQW